MTRGWEYWRRLLFGRYRIDDPRPIAAAAPYTFYLPSENELLALTPGDRVKAIFVGEPPGDAWSAERLWVTIDTVDRDTLAGTLANDPSDLPQLRHGMAITLKRSDAIDIDWNEARATAPPPSPPQRTYWERCLVDRCVTEERVPVHYLYREEPDMAQEGDHHADSGWRIRGDFRGLTDEAIGARATDYIALGPVLNVDDSWLHLLDAPVGSAFIRDWKNGGFVACAD